MPCSKLHTKLRQNAEVCFPDNVIYVTDERGEISVFMLGSVHGVGEYML